MSKFHDNITQSMRIVFTQKKYAALGIIVFIIMALLLLSASEFVFFEPYVTGHIPQGDELDFVLIITISVFSALVIPLGLLSILHARRARKGLASSVTGTSIGIIAGACSCGPLGFVLAVSLGTVGSSFASFLTIYDTHLRLVSICALLISFYTLSSVITRECKISQ